MALRNSYFPERTDLDAYQVSWSKRRQKRTLASVNIEKKRVNVARELNDIRYAVWLEPLLYHEMCHAVLGEGVRRSNGGYAWHGPEFKSLEKRHPEIKSLDQWIKAGGWQRAVRSDRSRRAYQRRAPGMGGKRAKKIQDKRA
ncbi:MAG: SprT-like domain-containing protein [Bdellovibrionales bacterium]|nr:SprT-like domain-containing protein [Bdellovibrionales bacterium]